MTNAQPIAVRMRVAADMFGLSERTIANMVKDGRLPSFKAGRARLIPVAALQALAASGQEVSATKS
jgi:excisionase family DNA binding protein